MITIKTPVCIDGNSLSEWLNNAVIGLVPDGTQVYIIPNDLDATGSECFFCSIDIDHPITINDLLRREVLDASRGTYKHFYADDVVAAACGAGELSGNWFWLYYTW